MSLGSAWPSDGTDPVSQAVNALTAETGALFVVAAGNPVPRTQRRRARRRRPRADRRRRRQATTRSAAFSSRGPRLGDVAVKPEISAPGVDIVAARAAGTSLGTWSTTTTPRSTARRWPRRTSPAPPQLVAQAHPDWDAGADQGRAWCPRPTRSPASRWASRAPGASTSAVGPPTPWPWTPAWSRSASSTRLRPGERVLTYTNATGRPLDLRLGSDVAGLGSDSRLRPDLTLSRRTLTVPARGPASVTVRLDPRDTASGPLRRQRRRRRRAALGTARSPASCPSRCRRRCTRCASTPGTARACLATGPVDVWSAEDGTVAADLAAGRHGQCRGARGHLHRDGRASRPRAPGSWPRRPDRRQVTPSVTDHRRHRRSGYDARDATPVQVRTPRADPAGRLRRLLAAPGRAPELQDQGRPGRPGHAPLHVVHPAGAHRRASTSACSSATSSRRSQRRRPAPGARCSRRHPRWPATARRTSGSRPCPSSTSAPVCAADYAGADVEGAVALAARTAGVSLFRQAQAAAAAGAAVLMVTDDRAGTLAWRPLETTVCRPTASTARPGCGCARAAPGRAGHPAAPVGQGRRPTTSTSWPSWRTGFHAGCPTGSPPEQLAVVRSDYRANSRPDAAPGGVDARTPGPGRHRAGEHDHAATVRWCAPSTSPRRRGVQLAAVRRRRTASSSATTGP